MENLWLQQMAEDVGFEVEFEEMPKERGAYIKVAGDRRRLVVNNIGTPYRRNFNAALELTRFQLGQPERDSLTVKDNNAAYSIAADMMLFAKQVEPYSNLTIQEIHEKFDYSSPEAIAVKLLQFKKSMLTIWIDWNLTVRLTSPDFRYYTDPQPFEIETGIKCRKMRANLTTKRFMKSRFGVPGQPQLTICETYFWEDEGDDSDRILMFTMTPE